MIEWKMEELGLESDELCVIGDRLVTDIEMATRAGVRGVLVLSGEATPEDLSSAPQNPDLVVGSVDELLK
jgi:NagD protein